MPIPILADHAKARGCGHGFPQMLSKVHQRDHGSQPRTRMESLTTS